MRRRDYVRLLGGTGAAAGLGLAGTGVGAAAEPCYYQVDFVAGEVEEQLGESDDDFYGAQERLIQYALGEGSEVTHRDTWINSLDTETRRAVTSDPIAVEGGTASVSFTVADGAELSLSLAVYSMPASTFSFDTADDQELTDSATGTFGPGEHTLEVTLPCEDGGEERVECPVDPAEVTESDLVDLLSVESSSFPEVSVFARVLTDAGDAGDLPADAFEVCESGYVQDASVSSSTTGGGGAADIVFVLDDTGSMGSFIEGVLDNIRTFANDLDSGDIDSRYALITFKDDVELDQEFTGDVATLEAALDDVVASGGGDFRENDFEAVERATELDYRPGAQRVVVDITDAAAQVDDPDAYSNDESVTDLTMADVESLLAGYTYIAVSRDFSEEYGDFYDDYYGDGDKQVLAENVGGTWIDLDSPDFSAVLEEISGILTSTYTLTYTAATDGDAERTVLVRVEDPVEGTLYRTLTYTVPS
ncbi:VWA domain-containing protein [Candidatus Halobonum tyrrellensis]|uniref:von Willebrand factor A n=1 Tax=Candidatus Halobonum tyrrellensis G22 TaxID=1324957 RepID=V4J1P6_9EURY|nr:VWA domain-containing protein [Candidatus Halobonum tyrrellensis]ESP89332.1 von Willebrand factor A [Candidatus Halobonum tyrrellensis G22]